MIQQFLANLAQDLRYASRSLLRHPTFTAVAIASLALGIGVNTAMFNLVSAVLLRPLPVPEPQRLVSMYTLDRTNPGFLSCSFPNYKDFRDHNTVFSGILTFSSFPISLTGKGEPEELPAQIVSGNYFDVLGVRPILGRSFLPQEDEVPGAKAVVVISYGFWMRHYAGSRQVIGTTIGMNNHPFTIVGVTPKDFRGANALVNADFWVPMMMYQQIYPMADWFNHRRALLFSVIGRLKPGVEQPQAEAGMRMIASQLEKEYPDDNRGRTVVLIPLGEALIHPNHRGEFVMAGQLAMGVALLVLLIACANVGNLLLVRAAGRRDEIALRLTLGVSRARLIAQLLTESVLLSLLGGVVALVLARWSRDLLWTARPPSLAYAASPDLDWRVLAFTLLISIAAGVIFGLVPVLSAGSQNLASKIRERRSAWTRAGRRISLRSLLVVSQVALAVVALAGAGLFIRSLDFAQRIDPGFETDHTAALPLNLKASGLNDEAGSAFYTRMLDKIRTLPGAADATLATNAPFSARARSLSIAGREATSGPGIVSLIDVVAPGYFRTLQIPMVRGRAFTDDDVHAAPRVALINETMARRFWRESDPVHQRLRFFGDDAPVEIVGVVRDSVYMRMGEPPQLMVYLCLLQNYATSVTLYVRSAGNPQMLTGAVRQAVRDLDSRIILSPLETMPEVIHESLWAPRLGALLFAAFGILAGILTVVGVYGVISYSVGQRTRELGIRLALGARPVDVLRQVLMDGSIPIAWGLFLGLIATLAVAKLFAVFLFGVNARDPLTLTVVVAVLLAPALAACFVPALRATRIDPTIALRDE